MTVYLKDYQVPDFLIDTVDLEIDICAKLTIVISSLKIKRNSKSINKPNFITLRGEDLILRSLKINNKAASVNNYKVTDLELVIYNVSDEFALEIITEIKPQHNTKLIGLYKTKDILCTQCEPEGFRRITYYLDRPDVMAKFSTVIKASKREYPVLLSNGNLVAHGDLSDGRHWVKWVDPFKKPSYLFAMVAGDLAAVEDHFVTQSDRLVTLKIYTTYNNLDKASFALSALKKAMAWDERVYGREYDLNIYMIVAIDDFNVGAMENKGLNVFNSKCILADTKVATDQDLETIDAIIGHEYFHNWSGNRVTCRDWFQLSLKEGFTVFREHQFAVDIFKSSIHRIKHAQVIQKKQFIEDLGPLSHPVRPASYMEINNFYTITVYEKGSEVIRMMKILLGGAKFREGTDLYFSKYDGKAVTIEDFIYAMEFVSGLSLSQFKLWYTQSGTPEISFIENYDNKAKQYKLKLSQHCPKTADQNVKRLMHIPIAIGLLNTKGKDLIAKDKGMLSLTKKEQTFIFSNIPEKPVLSILRDFSAPVKVVTEISSKNLIFLLEHDSDNFNRWHASRKLVNNMLMKLMTQAQKKKKLTIDKVLIKVFLEVLANEFIDPALKAEIFTLPTLEEVMDLMPIAEPEIAYKARCFLKHNFADEFTEKFIGIYTKYNSITQYRYHPYDVARRYLKNTCLDYLIYLNTKEFINLGVKQYKQSNNMTDTMAVLQVINNMDCKVRNKLLEEFYQTWQMEPLVVNKWLALKATSELPDTLKVIKELFASKIFNMANPNMVYALIGKFVEANPLRFHIESGEGYKFLTEVVLKLDAINPLVAARMLNPLAKWRRYGKERQELIKAQLEKILANKKLSNNVLEIVEKSLK